MINLRQFNLARFNDLFSLLIAMVALYVLIYPLTPHLGLWWARLTDDTNGFVYETNLLTDESAGDIKQKLQQIPQDNRLVLPQIQLNEAINEGRYANTLSSGLWRKPYTSTPDQGGNTVIAGHRFTYSDPAVFYHLDKMKVGDRFPLYWQGKEYDYEVTEILTVSAVDLWVENASVEPTLTLYTCTPLWTSHQRLVVKAKLLENLQ